MENWLLDTRSSERALTLPLFWEDLKYRFSSNKVLCSCDKMSTSVQINPQSCFETVSTFTLALIISSSFRINCLKSHPTEFPAHQLLILIECIVQHLSSLHVKHVGQLSIKFSPWSTYWQIKSLTHILWLQERLAVTNLQTKISFFGDLCTKWDPSSVELSCMIFWWSADPKPSESFAVFSWFPSDKLIPAVPPEQLWETCCSMRIGWPME